MPELLKVIMWMSSLLTFSLVTSSPFFFFFFPFLIIVYDHRNLCFYFVYVLFINDWHKFSSMLCIMVRAKNLVNGDDLLLYYCILRKKYTSNMRCWWPNDGIFNFVELCYADWMAGRKQSYLLLNCSKEMKNRQQGFMCLGVEVNIYF